jgi:hypothetical protein
MGAAQNPVFYKGRKKRSAFTEVGAFFKEVEKRKEGWALARGGRKKNPKKTNVRTYFIWPGSNFCTRTMT